MKKWYFATQKTCNFQDKQNWTWQNEEDCNLQNDLGSFHFILYCFAARIIINKFEKIFSLVYQY